jgi:hypothetical protein
MCRLRVRLISQVPPHSRVRLGAGASSVEKRGPLYDSARNGKNLDRVEADFDAEAVAGGDGGFAVDEEEASDSEFLVEGGFLLNVQELFGVCRIVEPAAHWTDSTSPAPISPATRT